MNMRQVASLLLLLLMIAGFLAANCSNGDSSDEETRIDDDDDNDDDDDDDDDQTSGGDEFCDNINIGALLMSLTLLINDVAVEMPATVLTTDSLAIAMEYSDAECNLEGGFIMISPDMSEEQIGPLQDLIHDHYSTDGIGCSSEVDGPFVLDLDPFHFLLPEGLERQYPMIYYLSDECGAASEPKFLPLDFTVIEP
jgi:hypothetical protein